MKMMKTVSLFLLLAALVSIVPARAALIPLGDIGLGNSWKQRFSATNLYNFDTIRLDLVPVVGQSTFEPPVFKNSFSNSGWGELPGSSASFAMSMGPDTQANAFDLWFTDLPANGVTFKYAAYDGATWRDSALLRFQNSSWQQIQLNPEQWDPGTIQAVTPVPEPASLLLLGLGLAGVGAARKFRKKSV